MASDHPGDTAVSLTLPESLSHWLDRRAQAEDRTREDVLLQLLAAYRQFDADDRPDEDGLPEALRDELDDVVARRLGERDSLEAAVDREEFDDRLEEVESSFDGLLQDVRERVVQVKREADAKAPADHDHADLSDEVDDLSGEVADLETELAALDDRLDRGFDNYENVLNSLVDTIDEVSARQTTLARAVVETREEVHKLAARDVARSAAEELKRSGNRHGVTRAVCESCDSPVELGLLTRAECPHCSAPLIELEPASGFFGKSTLAVGDRPALESGTDAGEQFEFPVGEIIESETATPEEIPATDPEAGATEPEPTGPGEGGADD
jgi:predicted Zn-ribbon and HTH transcriptional regulator